MTYTAPTIADLETRYPEFAGVADATIQAVLDEAGDSVGADWIEQDRRAAVMALAAHLMAGQGLLNTLTNPDGSLSVTAGPVESIQVGDVKTAFSGQQAKATRSGPGSPDAYASTSYGRRYVQLRARSFPAALVV